MAIKISSLIYLRFLKCQIKFSQNGIVKGFFCIKQIPFRIRDELPDRLCYFVFILAKRLKIIVKIPNIAPSFYFRRDHPSIHLRIFLKFYSRALHKKPAHPRPLAPKHVQDPAAAEIYLAALLAAWKLTVKLHQKLHLFAAYRARRHRGTLYPRGLAADAR